MTELQKTGEVVEADVVEANRGGLVVDGGLRGSYSFRSSPRWQPRRERNAPGSRRASRLRRQAPSAEGHRGGPASRPPHSLGDGRGATPKAAAQEEASSQLVKGQVLEGSVASVTTFGLFVDVGAADGLVHRSEITWDKGLEPTTLHRPGEAVRVLVTRVDRERRRISLSIKRLEEDPWLRVVRELAVGTDVDATVTRVMPYGAFARVPMGIEGLIHVSEIAARRIATPAEVVQPGDLVRVRVVAIDPERRRLSLSLRQAAGNVVYATRTELDANV